MDLAAPTFRPSGEVPGYDREQVDRQVRRIRRQLRADEPKMVPEDVGRLRFDDAAGEAGYDFADVDAWLEQAESALRDRHAGVAVAEEPAPYPSGAASDDASENTAVLPAVGEKDETAESEPGARRAPRGGVRAARPPARRDQRRPGDGTATATDTKTRPQPPEELRQLPPVPWWREWLLPLVLAVVLILVCVYAYTMVT